MHILLHIVASEQEVNSSRAANVLTTTWQNSPCHKGNESQHVVTALANSLTLESAGILTVSLLTDLMATLVATCGSVLGRFVARCPDDAEKKANSQAN